MRKAHTLAIALLTAAVTSCQCRAVLSGLYFMLHGVLLHVYSLEIMDAKNPTGPGAQALNRAVIPAEPNTNSFKHTLVTNPNQQVAIR